ncbi:hypothetical protein H8959_012196, partial [Pygathrix nigripes]
STSASWEEAVNKWEMQSLPEYQDKKAYSHLDKEREFSSSHNTNLYIHENAKFQKKSRNKIKTLSNLFWGNHPQRKRRGYSEKCCLTGCTKEELSIACLPYIDFKRLKEKRSSLFQGTVCIPLSTACWQPSPALAHSWCLLSLSAHSGCVLGALQSAAALWEPLSGLAKARASSLCLQGGVEGEAQARTGAGGPA